MSYFNDWAMRVMRLADPETAHRLAVKALALGLAPTLPPPPRILATQGFGRELTSPLGVAAGLDKGGEAIAPLLRMGASFIEIGAVTPKPQPGNPKPRLFRLTKDQAVINRFGFNSEGHAVVAERLRLFRRYSRLAGGVVGVNLGVNKDSTDPQGNYAAGDLQQEESLRAIVEAARDARDLANSRCSLMVKLAPDLSDAAAASLVEQLTKTGAVDGWIVSNTTIARPATLQSPGAREVGGLSGPPVFERSTDLVRLVWQASGGGFIVGAGGIDSGASAYAKIRAGASLLQLYTAMVYQGPQVIARVEAELADLLAAGGFASVQAAVAADHR